MNESNPTPPFPGPEDSAGPPLEPFDPPSDFRFEDEFDHPIPRPIPDALSLGRYATARRRSIWGYLCTGGLCLSAGSLPVVREFVSSVVPVRYVEWLGIALLAVGFVSLLLYLVREGPYRYVTEGTPIPAQVRGIVFASPKFSVPFLLPVPALELVLSIALHRWTAHRIVSEIEYRDPETGELRTATMRSRGVPLLAQDSLTTSFRVGDYVTAVFLPDAPGKSLRLYPFLDLHPGSGVIDREVREKTRPLGVVALVLFLGSLLFIAWSNLYAERYHPLISTLPQLLTIAAGGLVGFCLLRSMLWLTPRLDSKIKERESAKKAKGTIRGEPIALDPKEAKEQLDPRGCGCMAIAIVVGVLILGPVLLRWSWALNALLDRSPPTYYSFRVVNFPWSPGNSLLGLRSVRIVFDGGDPQPTELLSTPGEIGSLRDKRGFADVRQGFFGWPWIKRIQPVPKPLGP